jgi:cytochrome c553
MQRVSLVIALGSMASSILLAFSAAVAGVTGDRELGQYLSSECVTCHLLSGKVVGGVPAIVGVDAVSFVAVMNSYKKKERDNQAMQAIASKFNDEEIAALAVYFESVKTNR